MQVKAAEIDKILILLEETPRRLTSLTDSLESAQLHIKPDEEAWSVKDILAHLRACADIWGKSIMMMLSQDHPTLRYVSPRTWIRKTDYPAQEFHISLLAFTKLRNDFLQSLKTLAIEDWSRGATFTGTVRGRDQTVFSYAQRIADHEAQHLDQIENILNTFQHT